MAPAGARRKAPTSAVARAFHRSASSPVEPRAQIEARPLDDDEVRKRQQLAMAVPARQPGERVGADHPGERAIRATARAWRQRVDRIAASAALDFGQVDVDPFEPGDRQLEHRDAISALAHPATRDAAGRPTAPATPARPRPVARPSRCAGDRSGRDRTSRRGTRAANRLRRPPAMNARCRLRRRVRRRARRYVCSAAQNDDPGCRRNSRSASLDARPRIWLRCGKRPKRAITSA